MNNWHIYGLPGSHVVTREHSSNISLLDPVTQFALFSADFNYNHALICTLHSKLGPAWNAFLLFETEMYNQV